MLESIQNAVDFLSKGGIVMIFIGLCSLTAIVLFIERWIALRTASRQARRLESGLIDAISQGQFERASSLCDAHPCALATLAQSGIDHRDLTREALQEVLSDEGRRQEAKLNRFIPAVGAISTISPLLGLLGTVTGMIAVFSRLADEYASGAVANPGMLAGGIWEALLTTAAGLCVAIPAFVLHRILTGQLDAILLQLESTATRIVDILTPAPKASYPVFAADAAPAPQKNT